MTLTDAVADSVNAWCGSCTPVGNRQSCRQCSELARAHAEEALEALAEVAREHGATHLEFTDDGPRLVKATEQAWEWDDYDRALLDQVSLPDDPSDRPLFVLSPVEVTDE